MRITIKGLLCDPPPSGLGYCCPWFFFHRFRQTSLIAARLGVDPRSVRQAKALAKQDSCRGCPNCLHAKITLSGEKRKKQE